MPTTATMDFTPAIAIPALLVADSKRALLRAANSVPA